MGAFDIAIPCEHGTVHRQLVRNCLMWRAHARVLRRFLPPQSGGPFSFEIGISGPTLKDWTETVAPTDVPIKGYALDRRGKASDFVGNWGNEGCASAEDVRAIYGYQRKDVAWDTLDDADGLLFWTKGDNAEGAYSGWHTWANRVSWGRHGDWTPLDWDPNTGAYPQPYEWVDCQPWEGPDPVTNPGHGFPWCSPRIHPDWWQNVGPPTDPPKDHPDNRNPWNIACPSCATQSAHELAGYRNACVFILIKGGGYADEAFAAAIFRAPVGWRLGGAISVRYRGRWGT